MEGKKVLNVVDDKFGTPTYTHDFAKTVEELIRNKYYGLYNIVCQGQTSRLEVAAHIIKYLDLQDKVKINKVKSDYFSREYFAPRPNSEILINKKLELRGINLMGDWKQRLKEYLNEEFKSEL